MYLVLIAWHQPLGWGMSPRAAQKGKFVVLHPRWSLPRVSRACGQRRRGRRGPGRSPWTTSGATSSCATPPRPFGPLRRAPCVSPTANDRKAPLICPKVLTVYQSAVVARPSRPEGMCPRRDRTFGGEWRSAVSTAPRPGTARRRSPPPQGTIPIHAFPSNPRRGLGP